MRHLIFVLVVLAAVLPAKAQYYFTDTAAVNTAYRELMKNPDSEENYRNYVKVFPATWQEYVNLYVVPWEVEKRPDFDSTMAKLGDNQVSALNYYIVDHGDYCELRCYNHKLGEDSIVCAKIVNIAVCIPYGMDNLGSIQDALHNNMRDRREAMFKTVVNLTESDQLRFWLLYCSNITDHPLLKRELDELYEAFKAEYPEEAKTMRIGYDYAFNKAVFDDDGHGHIGMRRHQPNLYPNE